jgi:Txe/YoeB family toxin of Txe-Axe toxin-antitoxin module
MSIGVLGSRNAITKQIMQDEILNPILDDLLSSTKRKIHRIILPEESLSSTFIESWAKRLDMKVDLIKSDWVNHGRRAGVFRDALIEKESSVLLVFEGPRSRYYLDLAERIAKRRPDCPVYLVGATTVSPVLLEVENTARFTVASKEEKDILTIPKMFASKCLIED